MKKRNIYSKLYESDYNEINIKEISKIISNEKISEREFSLETIENAKEVLYNILKDSPIKDGEFVVMDSKIENYVKIHVFENYKLEDILDWCKLKVNYEWVDSFISDYKNFSSLLYFSIQVAIEQCVSHIINKLLPYIHRVYK